MYITCKRIDAEVGDKAHGQLLEYVLEYVKHKPTKHFILSKDTASLPLDMCWHEPRVTEFNVVLFKVSSRNDQMTDRMFFEFCNDMPSSLRDKLAIVPYADTDVEHTYGNPNNHAVNLVQDARGKALSYEETLALTHQTFHALFTFKPTISDLSDLYTMYYCHFPDIIPSIVPRIQSKTSDDGFVTSWQDLDSVQVHVGSLSFGLIPYIDKKRYVEMIDTYLQNLVTSADAPRPTVTIFSLVATEFPQRIMTNEKVALL